MANAIVLEAGNPTPYYYDVEFVLKPSGLALVKSFESEYQARMFVNKLKHSKKMVLVSYPNFDK